MRCLCLRHYRVIIISDIPLTCESKTQDDQVKSKKEMYRELAWMIRQNHPYDVPEILVTSIATGEPEYLRWLDSEI
jgi:uncharacterized protein involved in tolerance to divalent cations